MSNPFAGAARVCQVGRTRSVSADPMMLKMETKAAHEPLVMPRDRACATSRVA
jgi:hypothetical protein